MRVTQMESSELCGYIDKGVGDKQMHDYWGRETQQGARTQQFAVLRGNLMTHAVLLHMNERSVLSHGSGQVNQLHALR
jgi:hypothetical protein